MLSPPGACGELLLVLRDWSLETSGDKPQPSYKSNCPKQEAQLVRAVERPSSVNLLRAIIIGGVDDLSNIFYAHTGAIIEKGRKNIVDLMSK